MRKPTLLLCAMLACIVVHSSSSPPISGQEPGPTQVVEAALADGGDLWFVELAAAPTAAGGSLAQTRNDKAAFRRAAAEAGLKYQERRAFDTLWNGLSVRVDPVFLGRLTRLPGVKAVFPVGTASIPGADAEASPQLLTALEMTGADVAQSELGLTGQGVKLGVIDSGIDYHHPALGNGCFGPGCRVALGWDFVGDDFNQSDTTATIPVNPVPVPDPDPDDCDGHGTHVAGIAGADGTVTGVAPGVTFGAYRVFGCDGNTSFDIVLAAMERAYADGMDIISMSLGAAYQWPQHPVSRATTLLVNRGVVVVAAAGNDGATGLYATSTPAVAQKAISVASFDNTHQRLRYFTASPDDRKVGYNQATGAPDAPTAGTYPMARTGTNTSAADACAALPAGSLAGKVALIRRGTCTFHSKALNAENAGAAAVVIYNNVAGLQAITVAGTPAITVPVVSITAADGTVLNARLATGPVDLTWTDERESFPHSTPGTISSFSSYGLAPDLSLKPDIGAPGGAIFSTFPLEKSGYANQNGTSMATPHVAGAVALLLEAKPRMPAQKVRSILQNNAEPRAWWGNPGLGFLDNVHRQGAGLLQIDRAIQATAHVEPAALPLGESEAGPAVRTLTIRNDGPADVTFALSHVPALSTGAATFVPAFFTGFATVVFSQTSVVVPSGGSANIGVTITANPGLADRSLYGGYIVLTPQGGGSSLRVPYGGLKGDYQSLSILDPAATVQGFPWLAQLIGPSFVNQPDGATYTMAGNDVPFVLVHLDHQSRRLRLEVNDAVTGRSWHRALDLQYVGRNANRTGSAFFFALPWDGTTEAGNKVFTVPNGQYRLTLRAFKPLGDDGDPTHVESWTSPIFTIARPAATTP